MIESSPAPDHFVTLGCFALPSLLPSLNRPVSKRVLPRLDDPKWQVGARWRLGDFELDESRRELRWRGEVVSIEPKPLNLLMLLVRHPGELITKDELISRLWGGRPVSESVIARCVAKLRGALAKNQDWVRSVHGYGYRFDGWVEPLEEGPQTGQDRPLEPPKALPGREGWRLVKRLGTAGDSWLAEETDSGNQRVFKIAHDAARLTALKREATVYRLLAASNAPGVELLPLLDWNFHAPPYFLEFSYCKAGNLGEWLARRPVPLDRQQRLELISGLADQLSALHALGVLHKDIKPDNILVLEERDTALPRLALADLGSGGVLDFDRLHAIGITRMGLTLSALHTAETGDSGTPLYLAPEVLAGKPWTRQADIYALGIMLYQVLVGDLKRPLAPGWERDIDDALLREDIAATCDQSILHRLRDASELAQRLRRLAARHAERAAEAQARSEATRLRQHLARVQLRRRWQWAVSAALLIGAGVSTALYWQASNAEQRALQAEAVASAATEFLDQSVLGAADPYRAGGGLKVTVASVLDAAVADFKTLKAQPALQLRLGLTLASAYHNLGLEPQAREIGLLALSTTQKAGVDGSERDLHRLRDQLGWIELALARPDAARDQFQAILDDAPEPDMVAKARYGLARVRFEEGYFAESARAYQAVLAETPREDMAPWLQSDLRWDLAEAEFELHNWAAAEALIETVRQHYRAEVAPDHPRLLWLDVSDAYRLQMLERFGEAEQRLQQVRERTVATLGPNHPINQAALHMLGIIRNKQGRPAEALPLIEQVLSWRTRHYGEGHYLTRMSMGRLAEARILLGEPKMAEDLLRRAHMASSDALGADHPHTLDTERLLAEALLAQGRHSDAEVHFRQVLSLGGRRMPEHNNRLAWARYGLGRALLAQGEIAESRPLLEAAATNFRDNYRSGHSLLARIEALLLRKPAASGPTRLSLRPGAESLFPAPEQPAARYAG